MAINKRQAEELLNQMIKEMKVRENNIKDIKDEETRGALQTMNLHMVFMQHILEYLIDKK